MTVVWMVRVRVPTVVMSLSHPVHRDMAMSIVDDHTTVRAPQSRLVVAGDVRTRVGRVVVNGRVAGRVRVRVRVSGRRGRACHDDADVVVVSDVDADDVRQLLQQLPYHPVIVNARDDAWDVDVTVAVCVSYAVVYEARVMLTMLLLWMWWMWSMSYVMCWIDVVVADATRL